MEPKFKVGEVAILQVDPSITTDQSFLRINGEEVMVASPLDMWPTEDGWQYSHMATHPSRAVPFLCAPHELRKKRPPTTGETMIRALFNSPPVDRRQPATARQDQYDTAQALMTMGVRVRPGKWPVEAES